MAGTCKVNGSGGDAKKDDGRKTVCRKKKRKTPLRWTDDVVADLKAVRIKQWMETMQDREKWRRIVEEAKAHTGL